MVKNACKSQKIQLVSHKRYKSTIRSQEKCDNKFSALYLDLTVIQIFYKRAERHAKIISNKGPSSFKII